MHKRVRIIGAASGLGAQDQACADGPVAFHHSQAWQRIAHRAGLDWGQTLFAPDSPANSPLQRIVALCADLADALAEALRAGDFPLVIGGDHSVAIGTWSGVARQRGGRPGLLWIDAHLDSHTPATSYSGAVHGMPLACLLGQGDKRLLAIGLPGGQLDAAHCVVLGPRSYEPEELAFLQHQGVRVISGEEIAARGFLSCLDEALAIVTAAPGGFGVTLDLDVVDPRWAPGVGSPEPDGWAAVEVIAAIAQLAQQPNLLAMEIVEYNPDRDRHADTARLLAELIEQLVEALHAAGEGA